MRPKITVAAFKYMPYVTHCFMDYPKNCPHPGIGISVLYRQLITSGFDVRFVDSKNENNSYNMLLRGQVDMVANGETIRNLHRFGNSVDFTFPMAQDRTSFVVNNPDPTMSPNLLVYMCHWTVWLLIALSLVGVLLYKYLYRLVRRRMMTELFSKNYVDKAKSFSENIPLLCWALCVGIFCEMFQNYLSVTLTVRTGRRLPFHDTPSLLTSLSRGACRLIIWAQDESYWLTYFESSHQLKHGLKSITRERSPIVAHKVDEWLTYIRTGECSLGLSSTMQNIGFISEYGHLKDVFYDDFPFNQYVNLYRKNFPHKDRLRLYNTFGSTDEQHYQALTKMNDYNKKRAALNGVYKTDGYKKNVLNSLNLDQLESGFMALLIGLAVSCFAFLFNFIYARTLGGRKQTYCVQL